MIKENLKVGDKVVSHPPNNRFSSSTTTIELELGTILIRHGDESGTSVAPLESNPFELSLPYDKLGTTPNFYMVTQTITVEADTAETCFYAPGGGIHYILLEAIEKLKEFLEKL